MNEIIKHKLGKRKGGTNDLSKKRSRPKAPKAIKNPSMAEWLDIESIPKDINIPIDVLVYARWDYGGVCGVSSRYYTSIANYDPYVGGSCIRTVVYYGHYEVAVDPKGWMPIPEWVEKC